MDPFWVETSADNYCGRCGKISELNPALRIGLGVMPQPSFVLCLGCCRTMRRVIKRKIKEIEDCAYEACLRSRILAEIEEEGKRTRISELGKYA